MPVICQSILRYRWTPLLAVFLSVFLCGFFWQSQKQVARNNRTQAQLDLDIICDSLKSYSADGPTAIARESVSNLNARVLYELLSATNSGTLFLGHKPEWDRRQELTDPWGRPFNFQLVDAPLDTFSTGTTTTVGVKIWSAGPNGENEQGTGDDITCRTVAIRLRK